MRRESVSTDDEKVSPGRAQLFQHLDEVAIHGTMSP
jgi:hypothetical protein